MTEFSLDNICDSSNCIGMRDRFEERKVNGIVRITGKNYIGWILEGQFEQEGRKHGLVREVDDLSINYSLYCDN